MPALLIRHKVTDYAIWQTVFDAQEATRRAHGCQQSRIFRNDVDPNEMLTLLEWDDPERAWLFAQSDDLRDVLKRTDVIDEPDVWFLGDRSLLPLSE